jgi:hypothetical protein
VIELPAENTVVVSRALGLAAGAFETGGELGESKKRRIITVAFLP